MLAAAPFNVYSLKALVKVEHVALYLLIPVYILSWGLILNLHISIHILHRVTDS